MKKTIVNDCGQNKQENQKMDSACNPFLRFKSKLLTMAVMSLLLTVLTLLGLPAIAAAYDTASYNGHTYAFIDTKMTWDDAKTYCENASYKGQAGYLAVVTSQEENDFIYNIIGYSGLNYWLGGSDAATEGTWQWVDGEDWDYTNWTSGEPGNSGDGSGEDYLEIYDIIDTWNDASATASRAFVCEWDDYEGYHVTYSTQEAESGTAPVDANTYEAQDVVTVPENSGNLARDGYILSGWTTEKDGSGTVYVAGDTYTVVNADVRFYPKWDYDPWTEYASDAAGDIELDEATNTYSVHTAAGLAWIAEQTNAGNNFAEYTIELTDDINLSAHLWTPIGTNSENSFKGNFDGNNKTVSNLKIGTELNPDDDLYYIGLFGYADGADIMDLVLSGVAIFTSDEYPYVGALAGEANECEISNCVAGGVIEGNYILGGLVGYSYYSDMVNSHASVNLTGGNEARVGGLLGYDINGNIRNCYAAGDIGAGADSEAGGLLGYSTRSTLTNCYAEGSISSDAENASDSAAYAGGLIGSAFNSLVSNCYARGDIVGGDSKAGLGGLLGFGEYSEIDNCYATGDLQCGSADDGCYCGGLVGYVVSDTDIDCGYWNSDAVQSMDGAPRDAAAKTGVGYGTDNTIAKTSAEMQSAAFATLLDDFPAQEDTWIAWKYDAALNDGYPILDGLGNPLTNAWSPIITEQPAGIVLALNAEASLSVEAEGSGVLSYQWYSNASDSNSGGTEIAGKTDSVLSLTATASGTTYYYCVITNTDDTASANKTATITSDTAKVVVSETAGFNGGDGSEDSPYEIATADQLQNLAIMVNNHDDYEGKYFILTADLDLSGIDWQPIGLSSDYCFAGIFDGNGKTISNLTIGSASKPRSGLSYLGLFGYISGAEIRGMDLDNVNIYASSNTNIFIGGLIGYADESQVSRCHVSGNLTDDYKGNDYEFLGLIAGYNAYTIISVCSADGSVNADYASYAGGLAGLSYGDIMYSYADVDVSATGPNSLLGGLVGANENNIIISSYATGNVSGGDETEAGGLVGRNYGLLSNCYATGNVVAGDNSSFVGGLVGNHVSNSIKNCYATGNVECGEESYLGGFLGGVQFNVNTIQGYWNSDATQIENTVILDATSKTGIGYDGSPIIGTGYGTTDDLVAKTSAEMQTAGFLTLLNQDDDHDMWKTVAGLNNGYPVLDGVGNSLLKAWPPEIIDISADVLVEPGEEAIIEINAFGSGTLSYQWYANSLDANSGGTLIAGAVSASYTAPSDTEGETYYYCVITNTDMNASDNQTATAVSEPVKVVVSEGMGFGGGDGTAGSPYLIATASQLENLAIMVNEYGNMFSGRYFRLTNNIDLAGKNWTPIGCEDNYFSGIFDGNGKTISNLTINMEEISDSYESFTGLFGIVRNGELKNIKLIDVSIELSGTYYGRYLGALAGVAYDTPVTDCSMTGNINISGLDAFTGGLLGLSTSTVEGCSSSGTITTNNAYNLVGGLVAYGRELNNCYSECNITGSGDRSYLGGLFGYISGSATNCYATGDISGGAYCYAGGLGVLAGDSSVSNCYATGDITAGDNSLLGGLLGGITSATVKNCYATGDVTSTGAESVCGGLIFSANYSTIENNYATGNVTVGANSNAGGLIGGLESGNTLTNNYSIGTVVANGEGCNIGGSVGLADDDGNVVSACYWNTDTAGTETGIGSGITDTTTSMTSNVMKSTFTTLLNGYATTKDSLLSWYINANNNGYPVLNGLGDGVYVKHNSDSSSGSSAGSSAEVNGDEQDVGTVLARNVDGNIVPVISFDADKVTDLIDAQEGGATFKLKVEDSALIAALNGQMLENMRKDGSTIVIETANAVYTLPVANIDTDEINKAFGGLVDLENIEVDIEVTVPAESMLEVLENTADTQGFTVLLKPMEFTINCSYNGATVELSSFTSYVERRLPVPDGVDVDKISAAVVMDSKGNIRPVPYKIVEENGQYWVVVNSLTNSIYAVISGSVEFSDMQNHWAKDAVDNLGSRKIVSGISDNLYAPNKNMTRAEFAAIMVKALGLDQTSGESGFSDVSSESWYSGYIKTAVNYGLIKGYSDGTFHPGANITREQAMTIIYKAMSLTGLNAQLKDAEISGLLAKYTDKSQITAYAQTGLAACIQNGIAAGKTNTTLAPKDNITRAEVAVIIERLLVKSGLI